MNSFGEVTDLFGDGLLLSSGAFSLRSWCLRDSGGGCSFGVTDRLRKAGRQLSRRGSSAPADYPAAQPGPWKGGSTSAAGPALASSLAVWPS
jgi:hypothetical protein